MLSFIHSAFISFGHFSKLNPLLYFRGNLNTKLAFHDIAGFEQRAETALNLAQTHSERDDKILHYSCMLTYSPQPPSAIYLSLLQALLSNKNYNEAITYSGVSYSRRLGSPQLIVTQDDITLRWFQISRSLKQILCNHGFGPFKAFLHRPLIISE